MIALSKSIDISLGTREDATPYNGSVRVQWNPEIRQPVGTVHPPHKAAPTNLRTGLPVQRGAVRNILGTKLPGAGTYECKVNQKLPKNDKAEYTARPNANGWAGAVINKTIGPTSRVSAFP